MRHMLLASLLFALIGCTPDFDDPWLVKDLRVLAIKAEPPERVICPRDDKAADEPGCDPLVALDELPQDPTALLSLLQPLLAAPLAVELSVLAVDPRAADREVEWEVWACTPDEADCADEDSDLSFQLASAKTKLDGIRFTFDPLSQPAIPGVTYALSATEHATQIGQLFIQSLQSDPFRGFGGLPLVVEFRIRDDDRFVVRSVKRLVYTFPLPFSPVDFDPAAPDDPEKSKIANRNPTLVAIHDVSELDQDLSARDPRDGPPIDKPITALTLKPSTAEEPVEVDLYPAVAIAGEGEPPIGPAESYERYRVVTAEDPLGEPSLGRQVLGEDLTYTFYTTAGRLSHARTGGRENPFVELKKVNDISARWTAPVEPPAGGVVRLWFVAQDDRGGVTWRELTVTVQR